MPIQGWEWQGIGFFSGAGFLTTLRSESDILSDSGSPTG